MYSILTKTLITVSTLILVGLIILYHALEVQVRFDLKKCIVFLICPS